MNKYNNVNRQLENHKIIRAVDIKKSRATLTGA